GPVCCTSDLTVDEFKSLRAKMDASVPDAPTAEEFLGGTPDFRTDLYTGRGTTMTLRESIRLNEKNGVKHTPELKAGNPARIQQVFGGQAQFEQRMIDVLRDEGVDPRRVFLQSFNKDDILYWIQHAPEFGRQAVFLDSIDPTAAPPVPGLTPTELAQLHSQGVRYFAPPMPPLLAVDPQLRLVPPHSPPDPPPLHRALMPPPPPPAPPQLHLHAHDRVSPSQHALDIHDAGFKIITRPFEPSDHRHGAPQAAVPQFRPPEGRAIKTDSD